MPNVGSVAPSFGLTIVGPNPRERSRTAARAGQLRHQPLHAHSLPGLVAAPARACLPGTSNARRARADALLGNTPPTAASNVAPLSNLILSNMRSVANNRLVGIGKCFRVIVACVGSAAMTCRMTWGVVKLTFTIRADLASCTLLAEWRETRQPSLEGGLGWRWRFAHSVPRTA